MVEMIWEHHLICGVYYHRLRVGTQRVVLYREDYEPWPNTFSRIPLEVGCGYENEEVLIKDDDGEMVIRLIR